MRILISGICGFVGSTLALGLRETSEKAEIFGFDNFVRPGSELNRLALRAAGINVRHSDLRNEFAMDLNPDAPSYLDPSVTFLEQDCSSRWQLESDSLNVVFTSNFFEHLSDKAALGRTLDEVFRCLVPGGKLIAMGPNIKHLPGSYWDFWDHYLPLTETSLSEGLNSRGFKIEKCIGKFLPYTMVKSREYPKFFLKLYLKLPVAWRILGKQFLVIARKPSRSRPLTSDFRPLTSDLSRR